MSLLMVSFIIGGVYGTSSCKQYNQIRICSQDQLQTFDVNIYGVSDKHLLNLEEFRLLYFPQVTSAILHHFRQLFHGSLLLQDYRSPNIFWHGRDTEPNDKGPWFDDGDGDHRHLWTVILTKFVQNIDWCISYASRNLRYKHRLDGAKHVSGWIIVFKTQPGTTNVKIVDTNELSVLNEENGMFDEKYEETNDILGRIGYPLPLSKQQMKIAKSNGFIGEHPDSYILNKNAQRFNNLTILAKYRLVWHRSRLMLPNKL